MLLNFFTNIKNIRNAIDTNKLVVFAGAGISVDSGIPNWKSLIDEIKSEITIPQNETDYLRIAQMYYNERQQKEYIDKIRTTFKHKKTRYNEIHEWIFKLNPEHILTTNYDDLLEQVIKKESLPFSIVSKDSEFPYALNTNLLVKIHGDLDNTDIVLKEDDYLNYSFNHPLMEAFLNSIFASKIVLFVGYSFSDINLKMIVQTVRNILGKNFQNAYLLSVDENMHPTQREYLKNKGINVINYYDAINSNGKNLITEYLQGKNALKEIFFQKEKHLSLNGQNLLNFLVYLSTYDKFNEPLTEKNIIDQIYLSLARFSEFNTLPPDFIANLYPFNDSKAYIHNYESNSLLTKNNTLVDLFFNQVDYVEDEIKYKPNIDLAISNTELNEIENKLKEIIKTLNYSSIYYLIKENEKPDFNKLDSWADNYKKLQIKKSPKCNCLNCRLNRLEFSSIITETINSTINATTNIKSDLELAYANHKIGNFHQSYKLFKEVANKAWQSGSHFSYYIAKHNIKSLRNLIYFHDKTLKNEEKRKIVQEMDDIDFDKLISQIPYMGEKEYKLLKIIRDDSVLHKAEKRIDEIRIRVLDIYDGYKTGRSWTMGPYYPQQIENEIYKIVSFYTNNCLVSDEFDTHILIIRKGIELYLINYATHESYNERIKQFNSFFFNIVVFYCEADELKKIATKYEINHLEFDENCISEIIDFTNNFLKSFFLENNFIGRNTFSNDLTKNQTTIGFFGNKCRKIFNNIFLILSSFKLPLEKSNSLIQSLLDFIHNETFLNWKNIEYLCAFMYKNYHLFTKHHLITLLTSVHTKFNIYNNAELLHTVAYIFKENNFDGISDNDLIFNTISLNKQTDRNTKILIYLWAISNDEIKQKLKSIIIDKLEKDFNEDLYINAAYENIIDYNKFFSQYISRIDNTKGNGDYTINSGRPRMQSFVFINAMIFIYTMNVKSNDKRLNKFTNLTDYMEFYLYPEKFDYSKFKIEWLDIIDGRDAFYKRFSKIVSLKKNIEVALKEKFDPEIAEIYIKYFIK